MKVRTWMVVMVLLVIFIMFSAKEKPALQEPPARPWPRKPREYPVYIDDPTMYLDQQILYSEWDQKLNSVVI
jgi:hypothetical protein